MQSHKQQSTHANCSDRMHIAIKPEGAERHLLDVGIDRYPIPGQKFLLRSLPAPRQLPVLRPLPTPR